MLERSERSEKSLLGSGTERTERRHGEGQLESQRGSRFNSPMAQMDRLFDEVFKRPFFSLWSPRLSGEESERLFVPVDIYEDGESVVVKAECPGIRKEDLNIQLTPDSITISGQKSSERRVEESNFYRLECSSGSFTRTCHLPAEIITDKARAIFRDGVLEVRIPKSEQAAERVRKLNIE